MYMLTIMLTIFLRLNTGLFCFKQLPLSFGYILLPGARLLSGYLITSFNPLDFHSVINSLGDPRLKTRSLNALKYLYAG